MYTRRVPAAGDPGAEQKNDLNTHMSCGPFIFDGSNIFVVVVQVKCSSSVRASRTDQNRVHHKKAQIKEQLREAETHRDKDRLDTKKIRQKGFADSTYHEVLR